MTQPQNQGFPLAVTPEITAILDTVEVHEAADGVKRAMVWVPTGGADLAEFRSTFGDIVPPGSILLVDRERGVAMRYRDLNELETLLPRREPPSSICSHPGCTNRADRLYRAFCRTCRQRRQVCDDHPPRPGDVPLAHPATAWIDECRACRGPDSEAELPEARRGYPLTPPYVMRDPRGAFRLVTRENQGLAVAWTLENPDPTLFSHHYLRCLICGESTPGYENFMVHREVWASTGYGEYAGVMHLACMERQIGREIQVEDLSGAPLNDLLKLFFARGEAAKDRRIREAVALAEWNVLSTLGAHAEEGE